MYSFICSQHVTRKTVFLLGNLDVKRKSTFPLSLHFKCIALGLLQKIEFQIVFWSEIGIMNGKSAFLLRFHSNVYNNVFTAFGVKNSFLKAIWRYEAKMHIFEAILLKCIVSSLYSMSNLN